MSPSWLLTSGLMGLTLQAYLETDCSPKVQLRR